MILKRTTIFLILCTLSTPILAQRRQSLSHLSLSSDTLRMDEYTYVCDTIGSIRVNLYNVENHPGRSEVLTYKDGTSVSFEKQLHDDIDAFVITDELDKLMWSIVDDAFTKEQAASFGKWGLGITLNISSTTGRITDVYFEYISLSNYTKIPVDVYRNIELRLKNEVVFTLTEEGKRLTYCYLGWSQTPKGKAETNNGDTRIDNIGTININKGAPTTNRGTMTPIGGFGKGATTTP